MKIIITNDDGIFGFGLLPLVKELSKLGEVCTIVPEKEMSASSHSLSLLIPVRVREIFVGKYKIYIVSGTPADCVRLGIIELQKRSTDIVVSGINQGGNLGYDVIYSGTVAAAREGVLLGKTGIAVSTLGKDRNYDYIAKITKYIVKKIYLSKIMGLFNINFPQGKIKGIKITMLGESPYRDIVYRRKDPIGLPYYWLKSGLTKSKEIKEGTDIWAVKNGYISLTPLSYELTNYNDIPKLKSIFSDLKHGEV